MVTASRPSPCRWCCSCTEVPGPATATATTHGTSGSPTAATRCCQSTIRGSTGFGKKFIYAGNLEWGRKMHDDLIDAVDWAVAQGITARDKVAIMGGSYGGYATLAGLTFTPDRSRCGVDIVGPSNLFTLLQTIPPYWEAGQRAVLPAHGQPDDRGGEGVAARSARRCSWRTRSGCRCSSGRAPTIRA